MAYVVSDSQISFMYLVSESDMSNGRFLCLFKHLSEVSITKSNLLWFS